MKKRFEKGFTLIELIVASAVMSLLGVGLAASTYHVVSLNAMTKAGITAVKQVENAVDSVSQDAQMAQVVQVSPSPGFPFTIRWTEWNNTSHLVTYSIQGSQLKRSHTINSDPAQVNIVAGDLNLTEDANTADYTGGVFTCKITCTSGSFRTSTETRTFRITPRPN